jgi:hypothetical protein
LKIGMAFMGTAKECRFARRPGWRTHGGAPPEALLQQLEAMGFRHVLELLRSRDP